MVIEPWRYAVQVFREDGSPLEQLPVTIDWDPVQEWLRFAALRRGIAPGEALALECRIEPRWDPIRQEPYLAGVRARPDGQGAPGLMVDIPDDYFGSAAQVAVARLMEMGRLPAGAAARYLPVAFAEQREPVVPAEPRFRTRSSAPPLAFGAGSLEGFRARATATFGTPIRAADDIPVFLPDTVLSEAGALARAVEARETGGVLIGHLHRDRLRGSLFVEVTAQIPARQVDASAVHLTFTSESWTGIRAAIELRRRDEIMVGYWHSHPVRAWCAACPEDKQRTCPFRSDFYSEADRHLHRAIFPRAYSVALVVNDVAFTDPTFSMFGWRDGLIVTRGFQALSTAPAATKGSPSLRSGTG